MKEITMAELLGKDKWECRILWRGKPHELEERAKERQLRYWAVYRSHSVHGPFHNATDERYLLCHHEDPYWLNRGIPST